jgi:DNA-damage-inducible protein J
VVKGAFLMAQTVINIRMDEDLKKQVEYLFSEFGMNMTTAFTVFAKAVVREKRIPFEISASIDDFYNEYNQNRIKKAIIDINEGKGVAHELIEVSDE